MTEREKLELERAVSTVLHRALTNFEEKKNRAAWTVIEPDIYGGRIILAMWPRQSTISVMFSSHENGEEDLGTEIGEVSTDYFGLDGMVFLIHTIIESFKNE